MLDRRNEDVVLRAAARTSNVDPSSTLRVSLDLCVAFVMTKASRMPKRLLKVFIVSSSRSASKKQLQSAHGPKSSPQN